MVCYVTETCAQWAKTATLSSGARAHGIHHLATVTAPGAAQTAILAAQLQIEEWDEECGDAYLDHLDYAPAIDCPDLEQSLANIQATARTLFGDPSVVPIFLGGEHSLTPAIVRGLVDTLPPEERLGVLFFDAHGDLRDSYEGTPYSHACAARRTRELERGPVQQIGLRSYSKEEVLWARKQGITLFGPTTPATIGIHMRDLLAGADSWYVSIDLDALDPSECPAVGTPSRVACATVSCCNGSMLSAAPCRYEALTSWNSAHDPSWSTRMLSLPGSCSSA